MLNKDYCANMESNIDDNYLKVLPNIKIIPEEFEEMAPWGRGSSSGLNGFADRHRDSRTQHSSSDSEANRTNTFINDEENFKVKFGKTAMIAFCCIKSLCLIGWVGRG